MLTHYSNRFVERVDETIADLLMIGLPAVVGDPRATPTHTIADIRACGVVGIWIETEDTRPGRDIVNEAWEVYFEGNN